MVNKYKQTRYLFCLICFTFAALFFCSSSSLVFAQSTHTDNEDNLGVITDRQPNSPNFIMDSVLDIVGGDSTANGLGVQHGYFFIDPVLSQMIQIFKLVAVPEKRTPATGNNATIISQLAVRSTNSTILDPILTATSSTTSNQIYWTNEHGVYDAAAPGNQPISLPNLDPGIYDIYVKGYSTLSKRVPNISLILGQNELQLTASEAATALQPAPTDPAYYLLAGDVNVIKDPDLSCGAIMSNCHNVTNAYTGDEIGDDKINSIDIGILVQKLFKTDDIDGAVNILKEDLNGDGKVNSLDLGITVNNVLKVGG